jgi:hypothetical protein
MLRKSAKVDDKTERAPVAVVDREATIDEKGSQARTSAAASGFEYKEPLKPGTDSFAVTRNPSLLESDTPDTPQTFTVVVPKKGERIGAKLGIMLGQVVLMLVNEAGTAWNAGLREGDLLLKVNDTKVQADVTKVSSLITNGPFPLRLMIVRHGRLEGMIYNNKLTIYKPLDLQWQGLRERGDQWLRERGEILKSSGGAESKIQKVSIPYAWLKKFYCPSSQPAPAPAQAKGNPQQPPPPSTPHPTTTGVTMQQIRALSVLYEASVARSNTSSREFLVESEVLVPSYARHYREDYDEFDDGCGVTTEMFTTTAI